MLVACNKDDDPVVIEATSAHFYKTTLSLIVGGREKIMLTLEPEGSELTDAQWSSSDTSIVKVDTNGIATAIATGEASISLEADNNITGECTISVIESPITDLIMPDANYPIVKGAKVFLLGEGFTRNSVIILRKLTNFKSTKGDDYVAEILYQSQNDIIFYINVNPGWYSIILNEDNSEFDLGNIEVTDAPDIPKYSYDKNKIFWDDTHWRWFQLRGKVKKMKVTTIEWSVWRINTENIIYEFDEKGHLISQNDSNGGYFYKYQYDKNGRLIETYKKTSDSENTLLFEYGNHSMYCYYWNLHIGPDFYGSFILSFGDPFNYIWLKGLAKVSDKSGKFVITYTPNSNIVTLKANQISDNFINNNVINYNGSFPIKETYLGGDFRNYDFSDNGILKTETYYTPSGWQSSKKFYNSECPFLLYKSNESQSNTDNCKNTATEYYYYDKNWNHKEYNYYGLTNSLRYSNKITFDYTSYDASGNWTTCNVQYQDSSKQIITKCTREISYW